MQMLIRETTWHEPDELRQRREECEAAVIDWEEIADPASDSFFFYNHSTGVSQCDVVPENHKIPLLGDEMGAARRGRNHVTQNGQASH